MKLEVSFHHSEEESRWQPLPGGPTFFNVELAGTTIEVAAEGSRVRLRASRPFQRDVVVKFRATLPGSISGVYAPHYLGVWKNPRGRAFFRGPGFRLDQAQGSFRLAMPMLELSSGGAITIFGADVEHHWELVAEADSVIGTTILRAEAGAHEDEFFRFCWFDAEESRESSALAWMKHTGLARYSSPSWLHDIVFQDYDFFSKNGRGWFADIERLADYMPAEHRHRALFTLHGWYDVVGSYGVSPDGKAPLPEWTTFPHVNHPDLLAQSFEGEVPEMQRGGAAYRWRNLGKYHPVPMNWQAVRERLEYARHKGFRSALYLLTGMAASGDWRSVSPGTAIEEDRLLWQGPDLIGPTHLRNPLHPSVVDWALNYTRTVLNLVGDVCDALVIDESYFIKAGALGPQACPGYADRAQFRLFQRINETIKASHPEIALLTADQLAIPADSIEETLFPYCLAADGIYQDSGCWPDVYDATRIVTPHGRAFICNWAPKSNLMLLERAVVKYEAELSWSNGCFGDDLGLADVDGETWQRFASLLDYKLRA